MLNLSLIGRRSASARSRLLSVALVASLLALLLPTRFAPVVTPVAEAVSTTIVLSQVYGGAGCGTAGCSTYKNDYIELFNRGTSAVSLNGWSVQYAAATGTSWQVTPLTNVTLQPGQYYLVAEGAGANGVNNIPTPDATGTIAMSATSAKVALVNTTTALSGVCGNGAAATLPASVVDFVGYGATANCNDAGATTGGAGNAPAPSTTNADFRAAAGCTDTDNNAADFTAAAASPRNTSTALNACAAPTPTPAPGLTLAVNDVSQDEGNAGTTAFTFTVSLSSSAHGGVTFDVCTADGTAQDDNPATEDNDYAANCLTGQSIPNGSDSYQFTVNVNGDTTSEPNETFFVNVTSVTGATVADGQGQGTVVNDDVTITPIHDIQGNGAASPLAGQAVTTTGVVTLLRTGSNAGAGAANAFFLQTPDAGADADPNTSQGLLVFTSSVPTVAVGDEVRVTGTVAEFNGMTEITSVTSVSVIDTGNPLPTAVTIDATILDPASSYPQPQLEKFEGMRMTAPALRSVSPNDNFMDVFTVLPSVPRAQVFREPGIPSGDPVPPDPTSGTPDCCIPIWDRNPERLKLDTNGRAGAPNVAYTSNVTFSNVAGPLDFAFDEYRLIPDAAPAASANMTAVAVPAPAAREFTVASYNIENFNNNSTQRQKAADTVRRLLHYPDVIGAVEIFDLADLQALRDEINNDAVADGDPNPMYEAFLVEADGTSEDSDQDVGFLVKTSRVSVTSVTQEREEETFEEPGGGTAILHDRPPLVLDATVDPSGASPQRVLVVVNHLRSFIDIELVAGDGPRVREKRKKQAESLADLLNDMQTANPGVPVISVGDYNAFQFSSGYDDSLSVIKGNPTPDDQIVVDQSPDLVDPDFFNLIDELPAAERYSFFFADDGAMQSLDHHLVNTAAHARHTRTAIARVNSDFPPAAVFATNPSTPERNSDHDPVVSYYLLGDGQPAGTLIISEFRFSGPAGDEDEFVELYNNTDSDISVLGGGGGWSLTIPNGVVIHTIPNGTVIPARGHYLVANSDGYSLPGSAAPDATYTTDISDGAGLALFNTADPTSFGPSSRLDAAGYASAGELYREGAGIPITGAEINTNLEHSLLRHQIPGAPVDTGNNATDFIGVATNGANVAGVQRLGAPGPENLASHVNRNGQMPGLLLDATHPAPQPPNRVRDLTPGDPNTANFGTLSLRRRFVNNTGLPVTQLRFRVAQVTTFPAPAGTADLRVLSSTDVEVSGVNDANTCAAAGETAPCTINVQGTVVDEPPAQPSGGGWNTTVSVPVELSAGDSVSVQFLLGVQQTGAFRFFINVEAVTEDEGAADPSKATQKSKPKARTPWTRSRNTRHKLR